MSTTTRVVALSRYGFGRLGPARWTWWLALAFAAFSALSASDATPGELRAQLRGSFLWANWLIAVPIAAALADRPRARSRQQGLDALGELAGLPPRRLYLARIAVPVAETAARMLLPLLAVCLTGLVRTPSLEGFRQLLTSIVAACLAAALLVGTAQLCGHIAAERGRRLWWAVLLLPWILSQRLPADVSLVGAVERLSGWLLGGAA